MLNKAFNISLRAITLLSKFLLIFVLASYLEPKVVGLFGLFAAAILYSLYFVGFDFYTFANRELLRNEEQKWIGMIRDQMVTYGIAYIFLFPLFLYLFYSGMLPIRLIGWFFLILMLEHIAQEFNRLYVTLSKQILASVILFIRSGLWPLIITVIFLTDSFPRTIDIVLFSWAVSAFIACMLGFYYLKEIDKTSLSYSINWLWIRRGVIAALPFLLSTITIRGLSFFDRYAVELLAGIEVVAPYVLFVGISTALLSFLDAGVFVFFYPKMIHAYNRKDRGIFRQHVRSMLVQVLIIVVSYSVITLIVIDFILQLLGKPLYNQYVFILPWLLLINAINAFSTIPHFVLYSTNNDKQIVIINVLSLLTFFSSLIFFTIVNINGNIYNVIMALVLSYLLVLFAKTFYAIRIDFLKNKY